MITLIRVNFSYIHRDGHFGPLRLPISIWNSRSWTFTVPPTISKVMSWQKALYDLNLPWNATDYDITSAFHQQQIQSLTLIADMTQTTMRRGLCSTIAGVSAHNIAIAPTLRWRPSRPPWILQPDYTCTPLSSKTSRVWPTLHLWRQTAAIPTPFSQAALTITTNHNYWATWAQANVSKSYWRTIYAFAQWHN